MSERKAENMERSRCWAGWERGSEREMNSVRNRQKEG